jgi:hypothetical protein
MGYQPVPYQYVGHCSIGCRTSLIVSRIEHSVIGNIAKIIRRLSKVYITLASYDLISQVTIYFQLLIIKVNKMFSPIVLWLDVTLHIIRWFILLL